MASAWYRSYERIKPFVIRIETADGFGTGFLFAYNKTKTVAAFATASHVIDDAADWRQPIKIWHSDSKETLYVEESDRVIWLNRAHDSATILIPAPQLKGLAKLPAAVLPLLDATKVKKVGVEVAWVGFPGLAPRKICFFSGCVSAYLQKEETYLIDGVAINGVSGGPVFEQLRGGQPQLIGVVSAYMANRRSGESLPGLLQAGDLTAFHESIQKIKTFDEEKGKEEEAQRKQNPPIKVEPSQALPADTKPGEPVPKP